MDFSSLPNWVKLWGVIDQDLSAGYYKFYISNTYSVESWSGRKRILLKTINNLGGTSVFLAVFLLFWGNFYLKCQFFRSHLYFDWGNFVMFKDFQTGYFSEIGKDWKVGVDKNECVYTIVKISMLYSKKWFIYWPI